MMLYSSQGRSPSRVLPVALIVHVPHTDVTRCKVRQLENITQTIQRVSGRSAYYSLTVPKMIKKLHSNTFRIHLVFKMFIRVAQHLSHALYSSESIRLNRTSR